MSTLSSLNDIKKGKVIIYQSDPHIVLESSFLRMQQRKPVMQTKMRNLRSNKIVEYSFKPGDKVEEADVGRSKASFLYQENNQFFFMDKESFEQFFVTQEDIGEQYKLLKEEQDVEVLKFEKTPISIALPKKIELKVTQAGEAIKGDTASGNVTKDITLETGATLKVPLFIKEGDTVRINTDTGEYAERV